MNQNVNCFLLVAPADVEDDEAANEGGTLGAGFMFPRSWRQP